MSPSDAALRRDLFSSIRHSVRRKLMLVVLVTTFVALSLMGTAMVVLDLRTYQESWVGDMFAQADLIGRASAPALAFDDEQVARENLSLLAGRPQVLSAAIYTAQGALFASYARANLPPVPFPAAPETEGFRIDGREMVLFKRIEGHRETLGTVYFRTSYELMERLQSYLAILAAVMAASFGVAVWMASWLQKSVTQPILAVTGVARQVMTQRDFSLRVRKSTDDEIGYLVDSFNAMLAEIGARTKALETTNRTLEQEMAERRYAEKALLAADRQKDQFLATLAHELRNPLAPLLNALEVLRLAGHEANATLATRQMMERQLRQLVQLVNDLLDVSRVTTGKLVLRKQRNELQDMVRVALEAMAPLVESRQHQLTLVLPEQPVYLMADATRIVQVLVNLLNNAAKFTDPGGRLFLTARQEDEVVEITVGDNGIGIAPAMLPLVFEMFAQADRSLERPHAGLGVGLSLARQLVELHGGSIVAHSDGPGMGSRFVVRLPTLPRSEVGQLPDRPVPQALAGRLRILLADDNVDYVASLAILLESCGHEVRVTHDGQQALDAAPGFQPQLCFLDIGLPLVHGYALARQLRKMPATRSSFLVAVSGWGQPEDIRRSREAGFDEHLAKPVEFERIQQVLDRIVASLTLG